MECVGFLSFLFNGNNSNFGIVSLNNMRKHITCMVLLLMSVAFQYGIAQSEETGTENSRFYYSGSIGKVQQVEFNLQVTGLVVSGSYIFEETGDLFLFNGRMNADKSEIGVLIYDEDDTYVASMEATLVSDADDFAKEIKGLWRSVDNKEQYSVHLKKQAELATISGKVSSNTTD